MAKVFVTQYHIYNDEFEESDVPEGMTIEAFAEARYCDGIGDLDDHTLEIHYPVASSDKFTITEEVVPVLIDDCDGCGASQVPVTKEMCDGEWFWHCVDCDEIDRPLDMTGRCGAVGMWSDDDGDEVRATCIVKVNEHIPNLHASTDLFWTDDYVVPTCDECSEPLAEDERGKCHDGKLRCFTCIDAMYRENGGE